VKWQKTADPGHHYGALLGYTLNNRWAIEGGVLLAKKNYYTNGAYFNTADLYMPANSKVMEVSGDCSMLEIPLNIKYNFRTKKNSSWFASTGISSYLMKKENYSYLYYYTVSGTQAWRNKSYKNSSRNIFSIAQLSAGYSLRTGKSTSFRIEPYAKLPLSGVGFGRLNLLSTGLNIGIVKELF
jgi:hypothetical protein